MPSRALIVTTMFDYGGVISYWRDIIALLPDMKWLIFTNFVPGVDPDPFQNPNVEVNTGLRWRSLLQSSRNLLIAMKKFKPEVLIFNGTLAILRVLPAILFIRIFQPSMRLQCIFHSGPIYQNSLKDFINRILVSGFGIFMHRNIFVSHAVKSYWLCRGDVSPRPFLAVPRQNCFDKNQSSKVLKVGFLGRLSAEKDPELFLKAMNMVRSKLVCQTELAGVGILKTSLEKKYPWASFVGWIIPRPWLEQIDLLVTTSHTEGWPYALGEAIEAGVPVIGIEVGGIAELLAPVRREYLQTSRDCDALANRIEGFLQNYSEHYLNYFRQFERTQHPSDSPSAWARRLLHF